MITAARAKELISYDPVSGILRKKSRPRSEFASSNACSSWNFRNAGSAISAADADGYLVAYLDGRQYRAHRLAWLLVHGYWPTVLDHQDGNRKNNSLLNLREVTVSENNRNRGIRSDNTSGFPGVYRRRNRWQAAIKFDGKMRSLGFFDSIEEAAAARKAADRIYGFHENHGRHTP